MKNLDAFKAHGDIIWNIANLLRGPYRPPQYRRVMIPLTVLRRLDCVLEASKDAVIKHHKQLKEQTDKDGKPKYDAETIEKMVFHKFKLAFFNTSEFTFQSLLGDPDKLAANLANYMAGFSSRARKIIEKFKFEEEIEKLEEANRLFDVIKQVAAVDLHPDTIPNIAMGYLFEDLVRRFNEQANEEAGDHFTPREVIKLMVNLLFTHDDLVYRKAILAVLEGMRPAFADGHTVKDRPTFDKLLTTAFAAAELELDSKLKAALLAPGSLGTKDPSAEICRDKKGNPEPDADLRDTENVPLPPGIPLPLPLDYESKKNKGKVDTAPLLKLVQAHCEAYLAKEVLPYRPDAWIDHSKIKVGYEIAFNRHFYEYEPPRPLEDIEADILALEKDIMAMLQDVTA